MVFSRFAQTPSAGAVSSRGEGRRPSPRLGGTLALALLASTALVAVAASPVVAATNADWLAAPASGDLNNANNWNPVGVPTNGFFQASTTTTLTDSAATATFGLFRFQTGATAYIFNNPATFILNGTGLVVDAGAGTFTLNNGSGGTLNFGGASTIQNSNTAGVFTHPLFLRRVPGHATVATMTEKGLAPLSLAVSIVVRTSASAWAAHMAR